MLDSPNKDWIQTYSGKCFNIWDPDLDIICIEDIAHSLSQQCRYAGHTKQFYSVAQHCVLISWSVPFHLRLWGLMHDATEAYIVDVPRPLKVWLTNYQVIERNIMKKIVEKFNMHPQTMPDEVKQADDAILIDERRDIMSKSPKDWGIEGEGLGLKINPWSPEFAKKTFLQEFQKIIKENV